MGPGVRRDWYVTERGCQWENVVSSGMRASLMRNGSGPFHSWRCSKGKFEFRLQWVMPPLEMWGAPLERCEAAVAAEQEE
jgi:hypothetical protein